jgi:4-amino-4-deoxy-L-arabinose transferase-like glycosyltransferase/predicted metal-dependent hydrolase
MNMRSNEETIGNVNDSAVVSHFQKTQTFFVVLSTILFAAFAFQLWYHATRASVTIDEPVHILAGHRYWQCGDFGINPEHPPLLKLLAAAPLISRTFVEPDWNCGSKITTQSDGEQAGIFFLTRNGVDGIVVPTRLAAALLSLLLAGLVYLAAWEMFGRAEALTALALFAFEPNLIAHGSLVTTDMALSATAFAAVYALFRYGKKPNIFRFVTVGLAIGLMVAAKHSAVIFVPILFALVLADVLIFRPKENLSPERIFRSISAFAGCLLIGLILLWAFYGFRYYSIPSATESTISVTGYIRGTGRPETVESLSAKIVMVVSYIRIFPESYIFGIADIVATGSRNTFIFNRNYATGQWFYFPVAFAVKSSAALLLLLLFGLLLLFFKREKRREIMFLLVPSLLFFAVALTSGMNIGVRHILPVYPFFIVVAAAGAIAACRKLYFFRYVLIALLLFHAATAVRIAPNYIAFGNDFWGGTDNTYNLLADSNVEWGQNLKLVNEYLARENISDCWFAGFAGGELNRVSQPCRLLPGSLNWFGTEEIVEPTPPVIEGTILLSVSVLPTRWTDEYSTVAQTEPIARIGGSILVYQGRFEVPLAAAMSHVGRSLWLIRRNRFEEAVTESRKAVEFAPDDTRAHFSLALALARAGQKYEAREEFGTAIELARVNPSMYRNLELRAWQEIAQLDRVK